MKNSHLTAIRRGGKLSAPMKLLKPLIDMTLHQGGRCLDYGCGFGECADILGMEKYDPHFHPVKPRGKFRVITCNYVLNTVTKKEEAQILKDIQNLLGPGVSVAFITVRADVKGVTRSKKGTYQRNVHLNMPQQKTKSNHYRMYVMGKE